MGFLSVIGIKGVVIIALVLGLGGWAGYNHFQISSAQAARDKAIAERDEAGIARDKAVEANKVTQATIEALTKEKADIQVALNNLDSDRRKNQKVINDLSTVIRTMATDPANKVVLSPVLQTTIDRIQKQRVAREALP
jgi:hypothetical protein